MKLKLLIILLLSLSLRLYLLDSKPAGFNADEAALGYNAYSLLLTGKDEHGHVIPINLESFGDFKPAVYSYLIVPLISINGLNEFSVRLPSAIMGTLNIYIIFLITRIVVKEIIKHGYGGKNISHAPLLSAMALAISPWHLHYSRGAWEVNVATTFISIGFYLILRWIKIKNLKFLLLSITSFSLSMYTYQSARVIAPLIGIAILLINIRKFVSRPKDSLIGLCVLIAILFPLGISIVTSDAGSRLNGVGILADEGPLNRVKEFRGQYPEELKLLGRMLHNRPVIYSLQFIKNYIIHFDGDYLFVNGDKIERNKIPETGLLFTTDIVLLAIGFFVIGRNISSDSKILLSLFSWLLISPIASALTFQVPHALRSQNMIIPLVVILALGLAYITSFFKQTSKIILYCSIFVLISTYGYQIARYLHQYYVHYENEYPSAWQYGFKSLVAYINENGYKYNKILVTDRYDQPYILFLFYLKYPPKDFQNNHTLTFRDKFNFSTVKYFHKYEFNSTNWNSVRDLHNQLIIGAPDDIPNVGANVIDMIKFPNGDTAFKIVAN